MSKIKIYELAKELQVSSKEVIELLSKKNIEVKINKFKSYAIRSHFY